MMSERDVGKIEGIINGLKNDINEIKTQNSQIIDLVQTQQIVCATTRQKFEDLAVHNIESRDIRIKQVDERLKRLEEKDQIGGTTRKEKIGLWTSAFTSGAIIVKAVLDYLTKLL